MGDVGPWWLTRITAFLHRSGSTLLVAVIACFVSIGCVKDAASGTTAIQSGQTSKAGPQGLKTGTVTPTSQPTMPPLVPNAPTPTKSTVASAPDPPKQPASPASTAADPPPTMQPVPSTANPSATLPVTAVSSTNLPDKQKFEAYMGSAKAFSDAHDKSKAIDSYEKAILVAPDDQARKRAVIERDELSSWQDNDWVSSFIKQFQGAWLWVLAILFALTLLGLFRRLYRLVRNLETKKQYCVEISPASDEFTGYFRDLVRLAHHDLEEQIELASRINQMHERTVVPTFRSTSLIASFSFSLPAEVSGKWWSSLATSIVKLFDPPDYTVELVVMRLDKMYAMSVRLCGRREVLGHWHESCADANVPKGAADLAYRVVATIVDPSSRR
jgi:hypothetical protein